MAFCSECGTALPEGAAVCPSCGFAVPGNDTPTEAQQPAEALTQELPEEEAPAVEETIPAVEPLTQPNAGLEEAAETLTEAAETLPEAAEDAPLIAEEQPAKKRSGRKIAVIIAACLAVAALIAVIAFSVSANSPEKLITGSLARTVGDLTQKEELKSGVVTVSTDLNKWEFATLGLNEVPLSADLRLFFERDKSLAVQANAILDEETLLDLTAYQTPEALAVKCDQLLPEVYGTDLTKLKENLPESIFAPDKSDYSLPETIYNQLMSYESRNDQALQERFKTVYGKYFQLLIHAACEYGNAEKENKDLTVGEQTFKTTAITLTLDENALADVCTEVYNEFITDEELRTLLTEYAEGIAATDPNLLGDEYDSVEEAINDAYENELSQENFDKEMKKLRETDIELTPVFYVAKSNKHLAGLDVAYMVNGEEGDVSLKLGEDLAKSDCNSLIVTAEDLDLNITRYVTERSEAAYSEKTVVKQDGERVFSTQYDLNKEKDTWTLVLDPESEKITLSGTCKTQEDTTEFTVNKLAIGGNTLGIDLSVVYERNAAVPELPQYREILALTEDEADKVFYEVDDKLYDIEERLGQAVENAFGPLTYDPGVTLPADTDLDVPDIGAGGDLIGAWSWKIEGVEDMGDVLCFTFNEDGTGALASYGEEQAFVYEIADGVVTVTTADGAMDVFSYSVVGESLYMDIAGQVLEFVKK